MTDSNKGKTASGIDQDLIKDLANLLAETDLSEIEVEQNGLRLRVARQVTPVALAAAPVQVAAPVAAPAAAAPAAPAAEAAPEASHPGTVTSPMVGTVYICPEPGAASFVNEGDQVTEGQTLLIIEAMKTMNAIPAPKAGRVVKILVTNEQPIEFGEALVIIE